MKLLVVLGVVLAGLGFAGYELWRTDTADSHLAAAIAAYERGDCAQVMRSARAGEDIRRSLVLGLGGDAAPVVQRSVSVCGEVARSQALAASGHLGDAIIGYEALAAKLHGRAAGAGDDAVVAAMVTEVSAILVREAPEAIAGEALCLKLGDLERSRLVAEPERDLPALHLACAGTLARSGRHSEAILLYETIQARYGSTPLAASARVEHARLLFAEAEGGIAGTFLPPRVVATTGEGPAVVVVRNASPHNLSLVFRNGMVWLETLPACEGCDEYVGSGPSMCPEGVPAGEFSLEPGDYDMLSRAEREGRVRPFIGRWTLEPGTVYESCFFVTRG